MKNKLLIYCLWFIFLGVVSLILIWWRQIWDNTQNIQMDEWKDRETNTEENVEKNIDLQKKEIENVINDNNNFDDYFLKEIPSDYTWRIYTVNTIWEVMYFSWYEPLLYKDNIHWLKILLSENFVFTEPKIYFFNAEYNQNLIMISLKKNWEYLNDFDSYFVIRIIDNSNKHEVDDYMVFYKDGYIWTNNKYSFFFIPSWVDYNVIYPRWKYISKGDLLNQLFLWFSVFNI